MKILVLLVVLIHSFLSLSQETKTISCEGVIKDLKKGSFRDRSIYEILVTSNKDGDYQTKHVLKEDTVIQKTLFKKGTSFLEIRTYFQRSK